jgi:hypothetical protein
MNNHLYHWHDEHMVRYEMQEVDRALEQARLLREAGLAGQRVPAWLARAGHAVHGLSDWLNMRIRGKTLRALRSMEPQAFSKKRPRSA